MTIVLIIIGSMCLLGLIMFIYGIKHAEEVDPNEPFIYGDYDPSKDPTKKDFNISASDSNIVFHECEDNKRTETVGC